MASKKNFLTVLACALILASAYVPSDAKIRKNSEPKIKYVFYMIGDGMGINTIYGAQLYNRATGYGPENINFLHFPVRTFVTTHSATSLVTDSAAAGTALATGNKTKDGSLGVNPDMVTVSNIAEWAKANGWGTGAATSVGMNHATPASFYAHDESRSNYSAITYDFIDGELDFLAGGGIYTGRNDSLTDIEKKIVQAGITILRGEEMERAEDVEGRLLCLSGKDEKELKFAIDQEDEDTNLSDFVEAGISYLDRNYGDKGFFFMIEGGKIDYATHSNDAVGAFYEVNDFAAAIDMAMAFYNEHPRETIIIVTADHDTGGLILGNADYRIDAERLAWQKESEFALTQRFISQFDGEGMQWDEVRTFLSDNLGLWNHVAVDGEFENYLKSVVEDINNSTSSSDVKDLYSVNSKIIYESILYLSKSAGYIWTHNSHSGSPVGLWVMGPYAESFGSCRDNTDIPKKIAEAAGL